MILGSGEYCYQVVKGWGQGSDGRTLGIASGVAVDSQDQGLCCGPRAERSHRGL